MTTPANFNGQAPVIDANDSVMLLTPAVNSVQLNLGDFSYAA